MSPFALKTRLHSLPACDVSHNPESNCYFLFCHAWTVRRLCLTGTNFGQRKPHENTTNLECELYLCLTLEKRMVWRFSGVYIYMWKNAHIFKDAENVRRVWRTQYSPGALGSTLDKAGKKCRKLIFQKGTLIYLESKTSKARDAQGELKVWQRRIQDGRHFLYRMMYFHR